MGSQCSAPQHFLERYAITRITLEYTTLKVRISILIDGMVTAMDETMVIVGPVKFYLTQALKSLAVRAVMALNSAAGMKYITSILWKANLIVLLRSFCKLLFTETTITNFDLFKYCRYLSLGTISFACRLSLSSYL
jgi:hypothetical protein